MGSSINIMTKPSAISMRDRGRLQQSTVPNSQTVTRLTCGRKAVGSNPGPAVLKNKNGGSVGGGPQLHPRDPPGDGEATWEGEGGGRGRGG